MAFVPFYLPKRICRLFFRSGALFFEKVLKRARAIFAFIKDAILLWLIFCKLFCLLTGKVKVKPA
jgi:hypothetical protein